jgi:dethiobiotin synthetase
VTARTPAGCFIAGTDTGVGKTRVTAALLRSLGLRGVRAAGMKPVAAGTNGERNEDVAAMIANSCTGPAAPDLNPYCFPDPISPHIAARRAGVAIDPAVIVAAYRRITLHCEVVLVEGTGGWLTPIGAGATMADVAQSLALPVVLVVGMRLGCLNHALLSAQAILQRGLPLAGWIGSMLDPAMLALDENRATLAARIPAPELGWLPHAPDDRDDAAHLREAADALLQGNDRSRRMGTEHGA